MAGNAPRVQEGGQWPEGDSQKRAIAPSPEVRIFEDPDEAKRARDREEKAQQHDADDLEAQRRAAEAADRSATAAERQIIPTWLQLALAVIGTGVVIYTVILTRNSVKSAGISADAAIAAVNIARSAAQSDLRPYVHMHKYKAPKPFTQEFNINFFIKNFGRTPALDVTFCWRPQLVERPIGRYTFPFGDQNKQTVGIIGPANSRGLIVPVKLSEEDFARVMKDEMVAIIGLRISYSWAGGGSDTDRTWVMMAKDGIANGHLFQLSEAERMKQPTAS